MNRDNWIWMPHPGHFICAAYCRFHLTTCVGDYLVSTVGEWVPDASVRELLAQSNGIVLEGKGDAREADYMRKMGFHEIGAGRRYETMVFAARKADDECCPWRMADSTELDFDGYNDAGAARLGHLALCEKWSHPHPGMRR
jgi:hypothetical protein